MAGLRVRLVALEVAAGLQGRVGLLEEAGPVLNGAEHVADVDKVEAIGCERPLLLGVIDLKVQIDGGP